MSLNKISEVYNYIVDLILNYDFEEAEKEMDKSELDHSDLEELKNLVDKMVAQQELDDWAYDRSINN